MDLFIIQYEDPPRPEDGAIQITLQAIFPKGEEYQMQPGDVYPKGVGW